MQSLNRARVDVPSERSSVSKCALARHQLCPVPRGQSFLSETSHDYPGSEHADFC